MTPDLDLKFAPVPTKRPQTLTSEQIAHYNAEGFISPLPVYSADEAKQNRSYFDGLLAQVPKTGAYSINCYQARCQGIWDICTEPRILDLVEDLIGPDIICWASHFFCKMPHDPKAVPWHQDASFWKLTPARTVTVWLAIDDADAENAAMRFLPRTHDKGHLTFETAGADAVLQYETAGADAMGAPFVNALTAGQVSLHADMLVHGSQPNSSDRRRCGLTLRYCPPEVEVTDENWAVGVEAIVCRGSDPSGRWTHHPRPKGDDVSLDNSPRNVGGN
ncbi:phytanoyl-CoA dioxygenase family protein [Litoreibacter roseus]|uniref:Syringomycin biosynthesis enzyme n=1 Tax=Litoreibacter roseus TaxID=2601869 RepID=A0A6N6JB74_9RHOB|nr:phytanoyl-CoA dioxygenase family protein [Litoreibacter roseus]GFE63386.1 syringomycin biosynthesis enzyme [Litoreibacter roseus]